MSKQENKITVMRELIDQLREADIAYYRDDAPILTDLEYNRLMDKLKKLEAETGLTLSGSPHTKSLRRDLGGACPCSPLQAHAVCG